MTNAASKEEMAKFQGLVTLFQSYSDTYDMDYLLMAAQGYQESRLDQSAKSRVGAIGSNAAPIRRCSSFSRG